MPSLSTEEGMRIVERDEHAKKADAAIAEILDPDSKVTVDRDRH
jgi:hypothetical protein